ncbi:MAG TPA: hypothetical protein VI077_03655 [Pseudolabrys sp.]|jgi:hypothetical protein
MGKQLHYVDLVARGIVKNRTTLGNWQKNPKVKFPKGKLIGPNTRVWDEQTEIDPWLASRPVEPKPAPIVKGRRGRPRKSDRVAAEA